jgi:chemotaxis regulatin CheY-phosphate phosphatase CheZ
MLLEAITRLELAILRPQHQREAGNVLTDLVEMSDAIARTRREIAAIKPPCRIVAATEELDSVVKATEKATSDILQAAEEVQEVAWILREKGIEAEHCETLDRRATDIYTACSFQDITGQRMEKVVKALRFVEQRINAMIEIWGLDDIAFMEEAAHHEGETRKAGPLSSPLPDGEALKQDDVDRMLVVGNTGAPGMSARCETPIAEAYAQRLEPQASFLAPSAPPAQSIGPAGGAAGSPTGHEEFEPPDPLTLATLHAVKRAALFG